MTILKKIIKPLNLITDNKTIDNIVEIARDGFGSEMSKEDVRTHVLDVDLLYLIFENKKLIGFSSYDFPKVAEEKIIYLNGIVVNQKNQKKGVFKQVNTQVLNEYANIDFLVMRTQNPVVYAATKSIVDKIYPNGEEAPYRIKKIAEITAKDMLKMDDYDSNTFVGRNTYGTSLYNKIPEHSEIKKYFDNDLKLNYLSGDSVIIVGEIKNGNK